MSGLQFDAYKQWLRAMSAKARGQRIHDEIRGWTATDVIVDDDLPQDVVFSTTGTPGQLAMLIGGQVHIYMRDEDGEWKEIVRDPVYVWPNADIENHTKQAYAPLPLEEEVEGDWFGMALAAFFIAFGICVILYSLVKWGVL